MHSSSQVIRYVIDTYWGSIYLGRRHICFKIQLWNDNSALQSLGTLLRCVGGRKLSGSVLRLKTLA